MRNVRKYKIIYFMYVMYFTWNINYLTKNNSLDTKYCLTAALTKLKLNKI